jgi:hypothetical protein
MQVRRTTEKAANDLPEFAAWLPNRAYAICMTSLTGMRTNFSSADLSAKKTELTQYASSMQYMSVPNTADRHKKFG